VTSKHYCLSVLFSWKPYFSWKVTDKLSPYRQSRGNYRIVEASSQSSKNHGFPRAPFEPSEDYHLAEMWQVPGRIRYHPSLKDVKKQEELFLRATTRERRKKVIRKLAVMIGSLTFQN
jgi:hypothetical protein